MNSDEVKGIVRTLLATLGGYFVAKGVVDAETVSAVSGAAASVAVAVWSVRSKRKDKVKPQA